MLPVASAHAPCDAGGEEEHEPGRCLQGPVFGTEESPREKCSDHPDHGDRQFHDVFMIETLLFPEEHRHDESRDAQEGWKKLDLREEGSRLHGDTPCALLVGKIMTRLCLVLVIYHQISFKSMLRVSGTTSELLY